MRAFAGRVGFTCMALGALAAGCNNTETAVFLTIRAGQSIAQPRLAEVRRIDIAVSGAETYLFSVAVAANQFADGVVTVRYRPGASSGTLLLSAVARSGGDENIGQGRTSAVLMAQQEVTAELVLEAAGMMLVDGGMDAQPPDLSPADVPRFDLSTLDGPPPDLALPDLVMQDMTRPPDFTMDLSMTDIALVMPDLRMPDMAVVMPDLVMPDMAMPDLVMVMPDLVMVMPDLTVRDMAMMMAMPDLVPPPDLVIPDFALPPDLVVRDLAPPPDLMLPPDLTPLPDLAPLPDLVPPKDFVVAKAVTLSSFTSNALLHTPAVIAAADFDQDNKRDVVVTTPGGTSMSVFYGNGDGTLTMNFDTASGTSPTGVVASDFNSDAGPDVITSDFSTNQVVCNQNSKGMRNNQFNQQVKFPTGPMPGQAAAADFNADTGLDLVVPNSGANTVTVLLNDNNKVKFGFVAAMAVTTGMAPRAAVTGDFNADGKADFATCNGVANNLTVFLGNGNGTFAAGSVVGVDAGPLAIDTADLNGDGKLDLVTANAVNSSVSVSLGGAMGTFGMSVTQSSGPGTVAMKIADMNLDGRPDLVVVNQNMDQVSILLGHGDGTFVMPVGYPAGSQPASLAIADMNNDMKPDVVVANAGSKKVTVLTNTTQ